MQVAIRVDARRTCMFAHHSPIYAEDGDGVCREKLEGILDGGQAFARVDYLKERAGEGGLTGRSAT